MGCNALCQHDAVIYQAIILKTLRKLKEYIFLLKLVVPSKTSGLASGVLAGDFHLGNK